MNVTKFIVINGMSTGKCYTCGRPVSYGVIYCETCRPK